MDQGSDEWKKIRKNYIGASDAPIIMGVSPHKTLYQLWLDKLGLSKEEEKNSAMQRGNDLEPIARDKFENITGIKMIAEVRIHSSIPFMMASMDGIGLEKIKNGNDYIFTECAVEIKCPGNIDHLYAKDGSVPKKYIPQLQHQMEVCDLDRIFYFSFDGKNGIVLEIDRDQDYINKMIVKQKEFWDCVLNFEPPAFTSKDYQSRDDTEWRLYAQQYTQADQTVKTAEDIRDRAKKELIRLSGNSSCQGAGLKLSRIVRKGNISYPEIPELLNVDLEKYRKPAIESWRIN